MIDRGMSADDIAKVINSGSNRLASAAESIASGVNGLPASFSALHLTQDMLEREMDAKDIATIVEVARKVEQDPDAPRLFLLMQDMLEREMDAKDIATVINAARKGEQLPFVQTAPSVRG